MGEIKRFIRDDGPIKVSRSLKELAVKINELKKEHLRSTGEEISMVQLEEKLEVSKEEIAMAMDSIRPIESIDKEVYEEDAGGETKINKINIQKDETNQLIDKLCLEKLIEELEDRDKEIILLRYYKSKTQSEVAKMLGITQVQVSRLEKRILTLMRNKITY
jgi:RNA polymerase sporulation-specific sigma factor